MPLDCQRCGKRIDFSGEQPSFCPYCGIALGGVSQTPRGSDLTRDFVPGELSEGYSNGAAPGTDGVPERIGGFRLTRLLGSGGMGAVYEGVAEDSGQRVAVKLLHALSKSESGMIDRFRQEGQLASQLAHPHCVFVLRADEEAGKPFIVMELMPGVTLRDFIRERGPLKPDDAVLKILDVIDGLIEAHRLNILHRDVKPSNCFVMPDGRVKVGDFGLSKSLGGDLHLTQTGSFLGTVLYAAPEQIRGDNVDFAADVYSVCATLYHLLTGQAPFQHENPTVVISRVISEPPPDIALRRPDVPRRLAKIVMRGLERDPARRFASLDELRNELSELVSKPLNRGSLGARAAAYFIDLFLLIPIWLICAAGCAWFDLPELLAVVVPKVLYFFIGEHQFGCTLGKWALRLRVTAAGGGPASVSRLLLRSLIFSAMTIGAGFVSESFLIQVARVPIELGVVAYVIGWFMLLIPMRGRNGYRGTHELLSGTRVVQLPWARRLSRIASALPSAPSLAIPPQLPKRFGNHHPVALLDSVGDVFRLVVDDPKMRRTIHLVVRPEKNELYPEIRKSLAHPTRTRWIDAGVTDGWSWDAFLAPSGSPLTAVVAQQPLGWPETQFILEQLIDCLDEGLAQGSLRGPLRLDQIFIRADGRIQILDALSYVSATEAEAVKFVREVGETALGGTKLTRLGKATIAAPIPLHAQKFFGSLASEASPSHDIRSIRAALREFESRPSETAPPQRLLSLGLQGVALSLPLTVFLLWSAAFNLGVALPMESAATATQRAIQLVESRSSIASQTFPELNDPASRERILVSLRSWREAYLRELRRVRPGLNIFERGLRTFVKRLEERDPEQADLARLTDARLIRSAVSVSAQPNSAPLDPADAERIGWSLCAAFIVSTSLFLAATTLWSAVTRGGWTLAIAGLALVRCDGRRASWWQCGLRALVIFLPPLALLSACVWVKVVAPEYLRVHNTLWWAGTLWFAAYAVVGIVRPGRGLQDRVAGLYVVPR